MAKKPGQRNPQRMMVSPRSGAAIPVQQPGTTNNPKGSSMKQRARNALKKAFTEAALSGSVDTLLAISQDTEQGAAAVAAFKAIFERALGPVGPQSQGTVTVRTELVMLPPTGGEVDDEESAPRLSTVTTINTPTAIEGDESDYS